MGAVPIVTRPSRLLVPGAALATPLAAFAVGVGALTYLTGGRASGTDVAVVLLSAALASPVAAAVLLDRSPGHPLGLALCVPGLVPLLGALERGRSGRPLPSELLEPRGAPVVVLAAVLLVAVPLLLPDGRAGRGAARAGVAAGAATAVALLVAALTTTRAAPVPTLGLRPGADAVLALAPLLVVLAAGSLAHVDQACAWRSAAGAERDRRGWYLLGAALLVPTVTALITWILVGAPPPAVSYALAGLLALAPMGIVGLVLVPDPPPLDRTVARTLALGAGGVVLAVVYVAAFAGLAATDLPDRSAGAAVLTGVAALAALPAWLRCRSALETRLFGFGRQPARALSGLQERLSAGDDLAPEDAVTQWLAAAVRSPSAVVVPGPRPPDAVPDALVVPLVVGGAPVGHLVVGAQANRATTTAWLLSAQ